MFLFFYLIIDLYILILAFIAQFFNPVVAIVIPIRIPTKNAKAEVETFPVILEVTVSK